MTWRLPRSSPWRTAIVRSAPTLQPCARSTPAQWEGMPLRDEVRILSFEYGARRAWTRPRVHRIAEKDGRAVRLRSSGRLRPEVRGALAAADPPPCRVMTCPALATRGKFCAAHGSLCDLDWNLYLAWVSAFAAALRDLVKAGFGTWDLDELPQGDVWLNQNDLHEIVVAWVTS